MNTGAEAVETAIKLARKWGYERKGVERDRARILVCDDNFHGRTTTIVSFSSDPLARDGFGPYTPGFERIPFGDAGALAAAIDGDTVAFMVEPVQGEAGVVLAPPGYLAAARRICSQANVLLIADEVQTGLGRIGALFGVNLTGVVPDILCLAKALSGGVIPCGSFTTTDAIYEAFHENPMFHSSTFGNNPLAATAAALAIEITVRDRLPERSARLGADLLQRLRALQEKHPRAIREVRGQGLLLGIEMRDEKLGGALAEALYTRRILVAYALNKPEVIRIEPPLNIPEEYLDRLVAALAESLTSLSA
jgi:acetylornithine/succinyldiaminopimelate/putrescine aminotransferase